MLQLNFQKTPVDGKTHAPPYKHTHSAECARGAVNQTCRRKETLFSSEKVVQLLVEVSTKREGKTNVKQETAVQMDN